MRVAYLLNSFPLLSETFILNELTQFVELNQDTWVFSFGRPNEIAVHPHALKLMRRTKYFPVSENYKLKCLTAGLFYLIRSPLKFLVAYHLALKFSRLRWFFLGLQWAKEISELCIEHIHVHFVSRAANVARFISMLTGIPYSFTSHAEDMYRCAYEGRQGELIDLSNHAKFHVTVCKYNLRFLKENFPGLDTTKLRLAYCGVEPSQFHFHPKSNGGGFKILSVGRLVEKKGFTHLIEACRRLQHQIDFRCEIVGEGPLRHALETLIGEFDLKNQVILTGPETQQEIAQKLEACDLFVLPCVDVKQDDKDSCPVVLKEAMCVGKPVISTHISGIPELVRSEVGVMVPEKDAGALAEAILWIYQMDTTKRHKMGSAGRTVVLKEFNVVTEAKKLHRWILEGKVKMSMHSEIHGIKNEVLSWP